MSFPRASGILLHPTSLPGPFGIGDLGENAYHFADFLASTGQSLWQVLPLGPTGYGNSPYACYSAFAGNTLLISPEQLLAERLLVADEISDIPPFSDSTVDFERVNEFKSRLLRGAFARFKEAGTDEMRAAFAEFCKVQDYWLDDYALFRTLKDAQGGKSWSNWDRDLMRRQPVALTLARESLSEEVEARKFYQFLFFRQWKNLKSYCNQRGIKIIGDIPIFVAGDSADVWTNPDQFKLDNEMRPLVVAGVPPDYFSETGQLWGNPLYNWERMEADRFRWWIKRVGAALNLVDIARIDHFRGFAASWEIPGADKTAKHGRWVNVPGRELFTAIKEALGDLPIIAEDLGVITPDVERLRDHFGFPGMRVLQFAFGGDAKNADLPHNYHRNVVVYTGTHDNDTTIGWFAGDAGGGSTRDADEIKRERDFCLRYLNTNGAEINWDLIRAAWASVANTAIVPVQDLLGLGNEARMNLPNTISGNWTWRFVKGALTDEIGIRLKELSLTYGRVGNEVEKR